MTIPTNERRGMPLRPILLWLGLVAPALVAAENEEAITLAESGFDESVLLQEIPSVYGASKYEQKVTDAPSSISIITADEIRKYGYRTLEDILESVRGFVISNDRNYQYSSIRGFGPPGDYNNRVLVLIDGRRLNDAIYDSVGFGHDFPLDLDLFDRVEIIRGPSSSLYGANAFFAVINVITKRGRDLQGPELAAAYGTHESFEGRASFGKRFDNGMELLVSATHFESEGDDLFYPELDDPETNDGIAEGVDDEESDKLFTKLTYQDVTLIGAYYDRYKTIPTGSYETVFNDPRTETRDEQLHLNLQYDKALSPDLGMHFDLFYGRYYYEGDYAFDYSETDEPDIVINRDTADGYWWGAELQFELNSFARHTLVFGGEFQRNEKLDQSNFDLEVYFDDHRDSNEWGLYAQDEYRVNDKFTVNAGVRYDHRDDFDDVNPRLALIYKPITRTTVKLLYGTAFREPNAYEQFYEDGSSTQKPAPPLDPETIETTELILEYLITPQLRGTVSVFRYTVDDLITLTTDPADELLVFANGEEVEAHGAEFELEGKWANGWAGRVSYSYQDAEDRSTNEQLPNSPRNLFKVNVIAPLIGERLFLATEMQYTDERENVRGVDVDSALLFNLTLHTPDLWRGLDLSASVYNLFDEDYADPGSEEHIQEEIAQDGRTYRLKARYQF